MNSMVIYGGLSLMMKRWLFARSVLVLLALAALATKTIADDASAKPNFVVILADDLGAAELGCYGHPTHLTPELDRLAQGGVKFETCFTAPVCHPTRFTILTGQYGFRTGVLNFAGKRAGPPVKHEGADDITNHLTFAQLLQSAGYATALAGKWQLSGTHPTLIREAGFDEYCVWGYGEYYSDEDRVRAEAAGIDFRSRYWHPSISRNAAWVPTQEDDYGPNLFVDFLAEFIQRHRDQPFLAYYPMALTHGPWLPTPDRYRTGMDKTKNSKANFPANVAYMDQLIGRLVRSLEEAGVRENTVFIFVADNGTGGDGKSTATEKGARVPLIVSGPERLVRQRGSTRRLADTSDLFPTLLEYAGLEIPAAHQVDGHSWAPFLRGDSESTRDWIFAYQADFRILRTERWLLEENSPRQEGRLLDCGERRDGVGYMDVTESDDPEAIAARRAFDRLLTELPAPLLDHDGRPNDPAVVGDRPVKQKRGARRGDDRPRARRER